MIYNYITIDTIIEKINRYHNPLFAFNIDDIKEWVWEGLSKIGVSDQYIEQTYKVEIEKGVGKLPSNIEQLLSITEGDSQYSMCKIDIGKPFINLSYKIDNNGYVRTDFDKGYVNVNYLSFPIDDTGRPLIPDQVYFIAAIESFMKYKLFERAFYQNKVPIQMLQHSEKEWLFYCPAAVNSTKNLFSTNKDQNREFAKNYLTTFPKKSWVN